jgi:hypothetical protein
MRGKLKFNASNFLLLLYPKGNSLRMHAVATSPDLFCYRLHNERPERSLVYSGLGIISSNFGAIPYHKVELAGLRIEEDLIPVHKI